MSNFLLDLINISKSHYIPKNSLGILKEGILSSDERLMFILMRYNKGNIDMNTLYTQLKSYLEMKANILLNKIFEDFPLEKAKDLSKSDRKDLETPEKSFTYGEIEFSSFFLILSDMPEWTRKSGIFYDLGSGTGRAVLTARTLFDFSECRGIELLSSLHFAALNVVNIYEKDFSKFRYHGNSKNVEVKYASLTDCDWSDGDVVFANSTCFSDKLMDIISQKAEKLLVDALVITFSKPLNSKSFKIVKKIRYKMSWGPATVYYHQKIV